MENNKQTMENNDKFKRLSTREIIVNNAVVGFTVGIEATAITYCTVLSTKDTKERVYESVREGLAVGAATAAHLAIYDLVTVDQIYINDGAKTDSKRVVSLRYRRNFVCGLHYAKQKGLKF